jgi:hypothetical protein
MADWFLAEGLGNELAGAIAAYSDVIRAGRLNAIFVGIACRCDRTFRDASSDSIAPCNPVEDIERC